MEPSPRTTNVWPDRLAVTVTCCVDEDSSRPWAPFVVRASPDAGTSRTLAVAVADTAVRSSSISTYAPAAVLVLASCRGCCSADAERTTAEAVSWPATATAASDVDPDTDSVDPQLAEPASVVAPDTFNAEAEAAVTATDDAATAPRGRLPGHGQGLGGEAGLARDGPGQGGTRR